MTEHAVSLAYLAFDATRARANDVDFPIDIAVLHRNRYRFTSQRCTADDMSTVHEAWHTHLRKALDDLPDAWRTSILEPHRTDMTT